MKKDTWSVFTIVAVALILTLVPQSLLADHHEGPPPFSVIHYDDVEPAQSDEYEENAKAWAEAFKEAGMGDEYAWRMYAGPNFTYAWVSDMPNFAELDKAEAQQGAVAEALGAEKMAELIAGVVVRTHYSEITKRDHELTYIPEGGIGDYGFVRVGKHSVRTGMEERFKAAVKKAMGARRKSGSSMPTLASQVQFGHGSYMMVTLAASASDFYAAPSMGAILTEEYGAQEAQELFTEWRDCITDYETSDWEFRPDLSYMPGMYEDDGMEKEMEEGGR